MAQAPTLLPRHVPPPPLTPAPPRRSALAIAALLTLLAFALRVSNLALESLDIDEADGAAFIASGLPDLVARLFRNGENGPLYYLLLYFWSLGAGTTEWALRYPSVLAGTLTVPLAYAVVRRLAGAQAGLLAGLLAAASTYLIHYAQMVKMYALVAALAALAAYALLRALDAGRARWWAVYIGAVSVTFYAHIFGVLLLPWHGVYVALRWRDLPRRTRGGWLAAIGCLTLPYLPLGLWHLDNLRNIGLLTRQFTGARTLPGMLAELAAEYGARFDDVPRAAVSFLFGTLALLGLAWLARGSPHQRRAAWFLGLGVLAPVAFVAGLVALGAPVYAPRYVIVALLPFIGLWAAGLAAALRRAPALGIAGLAVVLGLNGAHLGQRDLGGMAFREDFRAAMGYIGRRVLPGDAVLFLSSAAVNSYRYYGDLAAGLIDTEALRRERGEAGFAQGMTELAGVQRRLWLVSAYFELPDYPPVQEWLFQHTHYEREVWFRNVRVALHAPLSSAAQARALPQQAPVFVFGDALALLAVEHGPVPQRAGEPWQVRLLWTAPTPPQTDYAVSLRLVDEHGTVWGKADGPPGGAFFPTSRWQPGQIVTDDREVTLAAGAPPGVYRAGLYVYRRDTLERLPVQPSAADPALAPLGTLTLERPQPVDPRLLALPIHADFAGGLRLLGMETLPDQPVAGGPLPLPLVFAAAQPPDGVTVEARLTDAAGRVMTWSAPLLWPARMAHVGAQGAQPLAWRGNVPLSPRFSGGPLRVAVGLRDRDGRAMPARHALLPFLSGDAVEVGQFDLMARPVQRELPAGLTERSVPFGDGVALAGLALPLHEAPPGGALDVRVAWRAEGEPARRWNASVQLLNAAGTLVAQHDLPLGGTVVSDGWVRGEIQENGFRVRLPATLAAGDYRLVLAVYDPENGRRLAVADGSDVLELAAITIRP